MRLIVNPHKIVLDKEEAVNEKEININKVTFEFAEEITEDFVKEAYFTYKGESYKKIIVNDECTIPYEVLQEEGTVEVGVVAYLVENETEIKRYNPSPIWFKTDKGSLKDAENSQEITPSEMEQYEQALQDGLSEVNDKLDAMDDALAEVDNLDIDANKVGSTTTVEITKKDGTTKEVNILDGADGVNGRDGQDGITPTIGDNGNWYLGSTDTGKPSRGEKGETGATGKTGQAGQDGFSPSASVTKSGSVATITITDKVGTTTTTITDGQDGQDGVGIPSGGSQGQFLKKNSATDYDTVWGSIEQGLPHITQNTYISSLEAGVYIVDGNVSINGYSLGFSTGNTILIVWQQESNKKRAIAYENFISGGSAPYYRIIEFYNDVYNTQSSYWLGNMVSRYGAQTISAVKTFSVLPESSVTPTTNNQLVNKKYVDDAVAGAGGSTSTPFNIYYIPYSNIGTPYSSIQKTDDEYAIIKKAINDAWKDTAQNSFILRYYDPNWPNTHIDELCKFDRVNETLTITDISVLQFDSSSIDYTQVRSGSMGYGSWAYSNNEWDLSGSTVFMVFNSSQWDGASKYYVATTVIPETTTSTTSTYTISTLTGNCVYKLNEITSLTITTVNTFDRESIIYFESGTTPTDISIPDTLTNLGDVPSLTTSGGVSTGTCDASKNYIISVLNNIAIWKKY